MAFDECQTILVDRERFNPQWKLAEFFVKKTTKPMKIITDWLDPIVQRALDADSSGVKKGLEECSFLEYMAANTSGTRSPLASSLDILLTRGRRPTNPRRTNKHPSCCSRYGMP